MRPAVSSAGAASIPPRTGRGESANFSRLFLACRFQVSLRLLNADHTPVCGCPDPDRNPPQDPGPAPRPARPDTPTDPQTAKADNCRGENSKNCNISVFHALVKALFLFISYTILMIFTPGNSRIALAIRELPRVKIPIKIGLIHQADANAISPVRIMRDLYHVHPLKDITSLKQSRHP